MTTQDELLSRLLSERSSRAHEVSLHRALEYILGRDPDEALDSRWLEVWDRYERILSHIAPEGVLEEIKTEIDEIQLVDEEVWDLEVNEGEHVTFLLGAGASYASGIPTVDGLLPELWTRARRIGQEDLDQLANWCEDRGITNIEDLLTAAFIADFAVKRDSMVPLLGYFLFSGGRHEPVHPRRRSPNLNPDMSAIRLLQDTLQTLFGLLTSTMIEAEPNKTHHSIVDFVERHRSTSIVTTNYDACMDQALIDRDVPIGAPGGEDDDHESEKDVVDLVKMHGSINWTHCDSCQEFRAFNLKDVKDAFREDTLSYPVLGICKSCGALRRPLLIPPLALKFLDFPELIQVWNNAKEAIDEADLLVVIGYSFSEADSYLTNIISRSMAWNSGQKMVVVNTDRRVADELQEKFTREIEGFDPDRILRLTGKSEELVPTLGESL